jgi:ATP-dependent DNA helicase DinG
MSAEKMILPQSGIIALPDIPVLCVNASEAIMLTTDGELKNIPLAAAKNTVRGAAIMVCHAPYTRARLKSDEFFAFDVLELFAFVHPVRFCVPTPAGLAKALGLEIPASFDDYPFTLLDIARRLLQDLRSDGLQDKADPLKISAVMAQRGKGWPWARFIHGALGVEFNPQEEILSRPALNIWKHLPEWADGAPEPPASHHAVSENETQARLSELLGRGDKPREIRPQQRIYSNEIAKAFAPRDDHEQPHIVLAEAGTGIGKTLGYLAPASVWSEKNEGSVWISTYTKNLQHQIDSELDRIYPNPVIKDAYVSVRKGRENYLCLLNLEDLCAGAALSVNPRHAVAAGIMARWAAATKDGDLSGSEFPGWLVGLLGIANSVGLADRRGECIYSACDHYHRCFVERSVRKSKRARLVIANHALVMIQSAMASPSEILPNRYIFDEGHHLFDAADSAFSAHLTAQEMAELRRWILGAESGGRQSRARGLKRRVEDLIEGDADSLAALQDILHAATTLCASGWSKRLKEDNLSGHAEYFLASIRAQVLARNDDQNTPYSIEAEVHPAAPDTLVCAAKLKTALHALLKPIEKLIKCLAKKLAEDQGQMEGDTRKRLDALIASLERRGAMTLKAWISMLESLEKGETSKEFIDWMAIERIDGQAVDVGVYRHYIDPMKPFATTIRPHLHGMAITSATLRDGSDNEEENWAVAQERTGTRYLNASSLEYAVASPFDYKKNTKVFIVNDVNKNDITQITGAYRALFMASGGGGLGLFTAVQRLRAVYDKIALPLEENGIPLYAQHVDDMDTGTLVDIFRDEIDACLLGTDAVRDGVDVPGESLRLLVFDRVPWPRPTILHKARREAFGGRRYDEMMTRLKLKQAFGRLIRREGDTGIFVMLDSGLPSRLHGAFPEGTEIIKTGLAETVKEIKDFFA